METLQSPLECSRLYIVQHFNYDKIRVIDITNKMIQFENMDTRQVVREPIEDFEKDYKVIEKIDVNCNPLTNEVHLIRSSDLSEDTYKKLVKLGFVTWEDVAKWTERKFQSNGQITKKIFNEVMTMMKLYDLKFA